MVQGDTLTIHLPNIALDDEIAFPGAVRTPSTLSLDIVYAKSGNPRKIKPNHDPISAFDWAGEMWMATNSGTFSVSHNDGSFSASGSFSSSGLFGEMGTERNGVFVSQNNNGDLTGNSSAVEPGDLQSFDVPPVLRSRGKRRR